MSKATSYAPGTPCWVDLSTADVEASAAFYGDLLGWQVPERPDSAEMGGYRRAEFEGDAVAGMVPLQQEGQPQMWGAYISVEDAEETAAKATAEGGSLLFEPIDVMGLGKMCVFADPGGAVLGIWQPGTFAGAGRVNGAGALVWNELNTRDPQGAKDFYGSLFGWTAKENKIQRDVGEHGPEVYVEFQLGGRSIAGMMDIGGVLPDAIPAHWLVYFGVADTDAAVEKVKSAGGEIKFGPVTMEPGRFAVATEPGTGAPFGMIAPND